MKTNHLTKYIALAAINLNVAAFASTFYKADNTTALNVASSWTNNAVPGAADTAIWDNRVSAVNTTNSLGANTAWAGIDILNPNAPVQINSGYTLTNGLGGIQLSGAANGLVLSNNVVLGAPQYWSVASGLTLDLGGNLSRISGGAVRFEFADATANALVTNTSSTLLLNGSIPFGTVNDTDFAAINGSGQIVGGSSLGLYFSNPSGSTPNISGTSINEVYDFNTSSSGSYGIRVSGNAVIYGVRINQPNANNVPWQLNTTSKTLTLNSILVTTNAGNLPVQVTGTGFLRIGNSGTQDLLLFQNNPAAPLVFVAGLGAINQQTVGDLVKLGAGTVEIQAPATYTGGTKVYEGTLLIDGAGNLGASPLNVFGGNFEAATAASNSAPTTVYGGATNIISVATANGQFLEASNLTLGAGAHLQFQSGNGLAFSTTAAPLVVTNTGTTLTATNGVKIDIVGSLAVGQFPLVKYLALGGNGFSAFSLGNLQPHVAAYLSNNVANSSIDLVVTANTDPLSWAAGNGTWDVGVMANWQDITGASTTYQQSGIFADSVLFSDIASGSSPITVTLNTTVTPTAVTVNSTKNYVLTGSGGIGGSTGLSKSGSSKLTLATANSFTGGLTLNSGIVNFSTLNNLGAGAITFAGGTLQYSGNTDDISVRTVTFSSGAATIDDGGSTITYANPVGNNGAGGLTKINTGGLTLNGANYYSGNTIVGAGTLALGAGSYLGDTAAIIISNNATLDVSANSPLTLQNQVLAGNGSIAGGLIVTNGATVSPGTNGVVGTLTVNSGDLTVAGGALAIDISTAAHDLLVINGNLNLNGGSLQLNVSGTLPNGTYKLIQYSGGLSGAAANLAISGFSQSGHAAVLSSATSGEIDLVVTSAGSASLVWEGDGGNNYWDLNTSSDWLNGTVSTTFLNADSVTFNDNSPNQTVNIVSAVQPASVTVNTAAGYIFQDGSGTGAGKLSGSAGLTKSGAGTLTVLTVDNNTGPTVINAGTIQVGNGGTSGDLGTGNITNNGAVIYAQPDNHAIVGQVSGTGSLTQEGAGMLALTANNTFSGGTTISSGAVQVGAGATTGTLGTSTVLNNGTLTVNRNGTYNLSNSISGSGSLINVGPGTVVLSGINSYQGGTSTSNGIVQLGASEAIPATGLYVDGTVDLHGYDESVNYLNGNVGIFTNGAASGTNWIAIGDDSDASTFSGVITENPNGAKVGLVKQGAATLQLNGVNNYSGGTLVLDGQLNIGPTAVVGGATASISLSNNTTLYLANAGSSHPTAANNVTILTNSTASLNSGNLANIFNGNIIGDASASNLISGSITFGQTAVKQFQSFTGTVVITSIGTLRYSASGVVSVNGGDNALFDLEGYLYTKSGGTISFGALEGAGSLSTPTTGSQTVVIGAKGINSTFAGTINPGNGVTKVGPGTLTLTGTLSYDGTTTVSNGVFALASDSTSVDSSPAIVLGASSAVIDVSGRTDDTLWLGNAQNQTLSGIGTINGNLSQANNSTVNVGLGALTVTDTATLNGPVNLVYDRTNAANASEIVASSFVVNSSATLTVSNTGPALQGGEVFHLFSQPVNFASVTLPTLSPPLSWNNRLAIDGTLSVLGTVVNTNPAPITSTVANGVLTLGWPSDHIGWQLQVQTNALGAGLGTNWFNVPKTTATNQIQISVNPARGSVFYRLAY